MYKKHVRERYQDRGVHRRRQTEVIVHEIQAVQRVQSHAAAHDERVKSESSSVVQAEASVYLYRLAAWHWKVFAANSRPLPLLQPASETENRNRHLTQTQITPQKTEQTTY